MYVQPINSLLKTHVSLFINGKKNNVEVWKTASQEMVRNTFIQIGETKDNICLRKNVSQFAL